MLRDLECRNGIPGGSYICAVSKNAPGGVDVIIGVCGGQAGSVVESVSLRCCWLKERLVSWLLFERYEASRSAKTAAR